MARACCKVHRCISCLIAARCAECKWRGDGRFYGFRKKNDVAIDSLITHSVYFIIVKDAALIDRCVMFRMEVVQSNSAFSEGIHSVILTEGETGVITSTVPKPG
jgi:hypothetical protein